MHRLSNFYQCISRIFFILNILLKLFFYIENFSFNIFGSVGYIMISHLLIIRLPYLTNHFLMIVFILAYPLLKIQLLTSCIQHFFCNLLIFYVRMTFNIMYHSHHQQQFLNIYNIFNHYINSNIDSYIFRLLIIILLAAST